MSNYTSIRYPLWNDPDNEASITAYLPNNQTADCAVVILPGGAYYFRAEHGIVSFVVDYRCRTYPFPIPLLDARRGIQFVRHNAKTYGINPQKIAIMGSSAGGHLAALTSTCQMEFQKDKDDALAEVSFAPNAQILCYPVIKLFGKGITHLDSAKNLLAENYADLAEDLSPDLIATEGTPQAFIWHTFEDSAVNVLNSIDYARKLKECNVPTELHIFPKGYHGLGLSKGSDDVSRHVSIWTTLLLNWLSLIGFTASAGENCTDSI